MAGAAQADDDLLVETDEAVDAQPFLTLTHSGYFRFRADLFFRGDLGIGIGGLANPLDPAIEAAGEESDLISYANMRFRWQPQLRIGGRLRIRTTLDVLDNIVLGSTPNFHPDRPDAQLAFLGESQLAVEDVVRVKHLWAEWEILHTLVLSVGRMPEHFGLGIATHGGECIDCDFGTSTDRVALLIKAFGFHSKWFFDAPAEGATTREQIHNFGQPSDLSSVDDAIRWGFTIGQVPLEREEQEQRQRDLAQGKPVFDWIFKNSFTTQELEFVESPAATDETLTERFDDLTLRPRKADLWMPDLWARLLWRPSFDTSLRIELEVAGMYGEVEFVQNLPTPTSRKDFLGFGGALQAEVQHRRFYYELELGFATGDDVAFGPFGPGFTVTDDREYADPQNQRFVNNDSVGWFLFNRDYHVDLLLYREVLGTVTNSVYVKPSFKAHLIESDEMVVGGELSLLYAHALVAESTPGRENPLGFETDLRLFYQVPEVASADLEMGLLVPFDALRNGPGGPTPGVAFTLQGRLTMTF